MLLVLEWVPPYGVEGEVGGGGGGGGHPAPLDPPMLLPPQTMNLQPMVFCRYKYIDTTYLRRDIYLYSE